MKIISLLHLSVIFCMVIGNTFANERQLLYCAGHEWLGISEDTSECGWQFPDGRVELLPKYKKLIALTLNSPKPQSIFSNTRSKTGFQVFFSFAQ